jgi:hypothetical protein
MVHVNPDWACSTATPSNILDANDGMFPRAFVKWSMGLERWSADEWGAAVSNMRESPSKFRRPFIVFKRQLHHFNKHVIVSLTALKFNIQYQYMYMEAALCGCLFHPPFSQDSYPPALQLFFN